MSTPTSLMTAEQFASTGPETDGCELVRGEIVAMPPPQDRHGIVCANSVFILKSYVKKRGKGVVMCNDAGIITRRNPDSVRGVDVALFLDPHWPGGAPEGYATEAPELTLEVRSPSQTWAQILDKVGEYLEMGVRMVWIVDPPRLRVTVFQQDQEPIVLAPENELDGGNILPGFRCRVSEFFE